VPNLRGHTIAGAEALLNRAGLTLGRVTPSPGPGAKVRSQIPTAGVQSPLTSKVEVVVSQRTVLVPSLRGMTVQAAAAALGICGLRLGALPPTLQAGELVAAEVPAAGSLQQAESVVTVILQAKPKASASKAPAPALPTRRQCAPR